MVILNNDSHALLGGFAYSRKWFVAIAISDGIMTGVTCLPGLVSRQMQITGTRGMKLQDTSRIQIANICFFLSHSDEQMVPWSHYIIKWMPHHPITVKAC